MMTGENKRMNRRIQRISFLVIFLLLPGIRVRAAAQDVILKPEENKVEVIMGESDEKAVSMQFTLEVKVTEGAADANVSFEFAPGIAGSVRQYRYDRDSGTLNVYLSGNRQQNLFEKGEFSVGKVVLDAGGGTAAATVGVRPGSLQIVNDAYDLYRFGEINATPEQKMTDGSISEEPSVPDGEEEYPPGSGESPEINEEPPVSSGSSSSGTHSSSSEGAGSSNFGGSAEAVPPERVKPGRDVGIRTGGSRTALPEMTAEQEQKSSEEKPDAEAADQSSGEEQEPKEEDTKRPETEADQESPDRTDRTDWIFPAALAAVGIAAVVVILLMVQEYRRKKRARERRKRKKNRGRKRKPSPDNSKKKRDRNRS